MSKPTQTLTAIPLGGLGEFGMNMMVFRCGDDIIVVDAGAPDPADAGSSPGKLEAPGARASDQEQKLASALNSGLLEFSRSGDVVRKGDGTNPTLVEPGRVYVMRPGDAHLYDVHAIHSPKRDTVTKLVRIEGANLDRIKRSNIKAAAKVAAE